MHSNTRTWGLSASWAIVLLISTAAPRQATGQRAPDRRQHCISVRDVHRLVTLALRHNRLEHPLRSDWLSRLRWSALLPRLTTSFQQATGRAEYVDLRADAPDHFDANYRLGLRWDVRATWDLAPLVFDQRELAIERVTLEIGDRRRKMANHVIRLHSRIVELRRVVATQPRATPHPENGEETDLVDTIRNRLTRATTELELLVGLPLCHLPRR